MENLTPKKPNLACDAPEDHRFPVIASPKLDGMRITTWDSVPLTRKLKDVPNHYIRETITNARLPATFDGELIVGSPTDPECFRRTMSGCTTHYGQPDFSFWVFDYIPHPDAVGDLAFQQRSERIHAHTQAIRARNPWFKVLEQRVIHTPEQLLVYEEEQLLLGFEGLIICDPNGLYKHGRSTAKEQGKMKVKRFTDDEAVVVGWYEQMHNANEATVGADGHTERSTHQANMIPLGTLGGLTCRTKAGVEFGIGTGFTAAERAQLWAERESLPGRLAKYKHFEIGQKDKPRHPVFLGWRSPLDL